jgi:hypothetical protein
MVFDHDQLGAFLIFRLFSFFSTRDDVTSWKLKTSASSSLFEVIDCTLALLEYFSVASSKVMHCSSADVTLTKESLKALQTSVWSLITVLLTFKDILEHLPFLSQCKKDSQHSKIHFHYLSNQIRFIFYARWQCSENNKHQHKKMAMLTE